MALWTRCVAFYGPAVATLVCFAAAGCSSSDRPEALQAAAEKPRPAVAPNAAEPVPPKPVPLQTAASSPAPSLHGPNSPTSLPGAAAGQAPGTAVQTSFTDAAVDETQGSRRNPLRSEGDSAGKKAAGRRPATPAGTLKKKKHDDTPLDPIKVNDKFFEGWPKPKDRKSVV